MTEILYDEMRAILGLPDVRDEVHTMRMKEFASRFDGQAWTRGQEVHKIQETIREIDALVEEIARQTQIPPMWTDNPARTLRTHYKPTRRVK